MTHPHTPPQKDAAGVNASLRPRCWTANGFLPFRLEVVTPVFVGSGEDLSPLEYVIREENGEYALHMVDSAAWLLAVQKPDVNTALCDGDMLLLRRLMAEYLNEKLYSLARLPIASPVLAKELQQRIRNVNSRSKAEIMPFARNPVTSTAILPGSSLKGAISTPIVDYLNKASAEKLRRENYRELMEKFFGPISNHAMQALKVADIAIPHEGTRIYAAREMSLKPEKTATPKTPCEALTPSVPPVAGGLPLYGNLRLDCRSSSPAVELPGQSLLLWNHIAKLCNAFYRERFRSEWEKFYSLGHFSAVRKALAPVRERIENLGAQEVLLRVGRYSHVESVTITNNKPQCRMGFGTTRTLADGLLPFGWVIVHMCRKKEYIEGVASVEQNIITTRQERLQARAGHEAALRAEMEQQRQKAAAISAAQEQREAEERQRAQEAAQREAELSSLSPMERTIAELAFPEATEIQSSALFGKLDGMTPELQIQAAEALKAYWSRIGKWQGKQLSPKQTKKVKKIKEILGE